LYFYIYILLYHLTIIYLHLSPLQTDKKNEVFYKRAQAEVEMQFYFVHSVVW